MSKKGRGNRTSSYGSTISSGGSFRDEMPEVEDDSVVSEEIIDDDVPVATNLQTVKTVVVAEPHLNVRQQTIVRKETTAEDKLDQVMVMLSKIGRIQNEVQLNYHKYIRPFALTFIPNRTLTVSELMEMFDAMKEMVRQWDATFKFVTFERSMEIKSFNKSVAQNLFILLSSPQSKSGCALHTNFSERFFKTSSSEVKS